eukprot:TRINITY_DN30045_c0_g1_i1.p1 TRINITY_DN30045_c0_g1~~TRINITY_DN30045_c0_g1_i1.p1  ORF type:complete len:277 (-),score=43.16 TRINITY_DN30045_c0_g1_i1:95-925(-)
MIRYNPAIHADPYADPYDDYPPYRDSYSYRDHHPRGNPSGGYRGHPPSHREPPTAAFWEPDDYRAPPHHSSRGDHHAREPPTHYREPPAPPHRAATPMDAPASAGSSGGAGPVGNITNSDDFASKDSRLFVGNLNTVALSKEDVYGIFGRLGRVSGISMHKGYAFVQFSSPGEARRAVALENGQSYAGQKLDLNIVSQPKRPQKPPGGHDGHKRMSLMEEGLAASGPPAKRPRPPPEMGNPSLQRGNLVTLANSDHPLSHPGAAGGGRRGTRSYRR